MKIKYFKVLLILTLIMGIGPSALQGEAKKHWWKFDETGGIIAKDSIGNVNGYLNGNSAFLGPNKGVQIYKNKDCYVSFDRRVGNFGTNDFSVYLEFKTNETLALFSIVGNRFSSRYGNYFCITMRGKNHPFGEEGTITVELCEESDGKNYLNLESINSHFNDGKWHSLKVVRKGKEISLTIDDVLENKITTPWITNLTGRHEFRLGQSLDPNQAKAEFSPNAVYRNLKIEKKK